VTEPQGDFPTCPEGESRTRTIKSKGASPVRRREEKGATCENVEKAMADLDDNPPHRERERTPEELRRSPKRNKKMKMEKLGELNMNNPVAYLTRRHLRV